MLSFIQGQITACRKAGKRKVDDHCCPKQQHYRVDESRITMG
jgi:hypothetical protein